MDTDRTEGRRHLDRLRRRQCSRGCEPDTAIVAAHLRERSVLYRWCEEALSSRRLRLYPRTRDSSVHRAVSCRELLVSSERLRLLLLLASPRSLELCNVVNYDSPVGTSDPTAHPCTSEFAFCQQGSTQPTPVSKGYYTTVSAATNQRVDQVVCPKGSYCVGGIAKLCPVNTFGDTTGLSTSACSGKCRDGYICDLGSTSATPLVCPAGSYCVDGVQRLCPAGTYGSTAGLSTPSCTERCLDTFAICAPGSTSATQTSCSKGSYSQGGIRCQVCPPWFQFTRNECLSREQNPCGLDSTSCLLV